MQISSNAITTNNKSATIKNAANNHSSKIQANAIKGKKNQGFTLIELLVAIFIFAIISVIAYRTLSSLIKTQEVVTAAQTKWGNIAKSIYQISISCRRAIPLVIRDDNGSLIPAVIGKNKLSSKFDAQLELTTSGFIGDPEYGASPPKRIGFRYLNGTLYLIVWPVLNRVLGSQPEISVLMKNIKTFDINFLYPNKQWQDIWPGANTDISTLPKAIKINIELNSGEKIMRQWIFR